MATTNDLAIKYAQYLRDNASSPTVAVDIARMIQGITYIKNRQPLSEADRKELIDAIEREFTPKKKSGSGRIVEAEDSRSFIEMINRIRELAEKK